MTSRIEHNYYRESVKEKLNQCDILHNVSIATASDFNLETGKYSITEYHLNYGVVINQECDLEHDFKCRNNPTAPNQDKVLPNILILPAYLSEDFKNGTHREKGLVGHRWDSSLFKQIRENNNPRFHFIHKDEDYQLPELVVDFKHVFSLRTEIAYKLADRLYYLSISELFREDLSHRYTNYLSRIGLPVIN